MDAQGRLWFAEAFAANNEVMVMGIISMTFLNILDLNLKKLREKYEIS